MTTILQVKGMTCGHCKKAVEDALQNLPGVASAEVDLEKGQVEVAFDENKVTVPQMHEAIEEQGYDVEA